MPAVHFKIQWPDGEQVEYYSPSTIIHQFFIGIDKISRYMILNVISYNIGFVFFVFKRIERMIFYHFK